MPFTKSMQLETQSQATRPNHDAVQYAILSAFIPGLGQLLQNRLGAAVLQFGSVAAYAIGTFGLGGRRALLLGLFWNAWSVIDAYRHATAHHDAR